MAYLIANIPQFKVWVRKEFTHNHMKYEGEYLHGLVIAVCAIPDRCLSFQVVFTGCDEEDPNPHGGAMWARMPITALIAKAEHVGLARSRYCSNSVAGPPHRVAVRAPQFAIAPTTIP